MDIADPKMRSEIIHHLTEYPMYHYIFQTWIVVEGIIEEGDWLSELVFDYHECIKRNLPESD